MAIPDFTVSGVLPPYLGPTPVATAAMSPYPASLVEIANKMCASNERKAIMRGVERVGELVAKLLAGERE